MKYQAWLRNHFFEIISKESYPEGQILEKFITLPSGNRCLIGYFYWYNNEFIIWDTNANCIILPNILVEEFIEFKKSLRIPINN